MLYYILFDIVYYILYYILFYFIQYFSISYAILQNLYNIIYIVLYYILLYFIILYYIFKFHIVLYCILLHIYIASSRKTWNKTKKRYCMFSGTPPSPPKAPSQLVPTRVTPKEDAVSSRSIISCSIWRVVRLKQNGVAWVWWNHKGLRLETQRLGSYCISFSLSQWNSMETP